MHLEGAITLGVLEDTQDYELASAVSVHGCELRFLADHFAECLNFIQAGRLWYFLERNHSDNDKDETFVIETNE